MDYCENPARCCGHLSQRPLYNKTGLEIRKVNSVSCSTPASRAKCQITLTFVTLMGDTLQLVLLEICLNFWLYPCCAQWVELHSEGVILIFMHLYFHEIYKKPFLEKIAIKMLAKVAAVWIETATQLDEI